MAETWALGHYDRKKGALPDLVTVRQKYGTLADVAAYLIVANGLCYPRDSISRDNAPDILARNAMVPNSNLHMATWPGVVPTAVYQAPDDDTYRPLVYDARVTPPSLLPIGLQEPSLYDTESFLPKVPRKARYYNPYADELVEVACDPAMEGLVELVLRAHEPYRKLLRSGGRSYLTYDRYIESSARDKAEIYAIVAGRIAKEMSGASNILTAWGYNHPWVRPDTKLDPRLVQTLEV